MFNAHRLVHRGRYLAARTHFVNNPDQLIRVEAFVAACVNASITTHWSEIVAHYNEATYLYPFWQNYPPDDRGRGSRGDQFPWIEVGEHAIGREFIRWLSGTFDVSSPALPSGPDERLLLRHPEICTLTQGHADAVFLMLDIKSAGPRDAADHIVASPNQVSGNGRWDTLRQGIENDLVLATGAKSSHDFQPALSPLYVLSDETVALTVTMVVKPNYAMLAIGHAFTATGGQPLDYVQCCCIPNGLLLFDTLAYHSAHPGLIFPGKDDMSKPLLKRRARISFPILQTIAPWRLASHR